MICEFQIFTGFHSLGPTRIYLKSYHSTLKHLSSLLGQVAICLCQSTRQHLHVFHTAILVLGPTHMYESIFWDISRAKLYGFPILLGMNKSECSSLSHRLIFLFAFVCVILRPFFCPLTLFNHSRLYYKGLILMQEIELWQILN